jgi:drug/metabolite transporter (DMT)-like permease
LLIGICFTTIGELMLKRGLTDIGGFDLTDVPNLIPSLFKTFTNPFIFFGFVLVFVGALFWLTVLSVLPLNLAYPLLAIGYLVVTAAAVFILGESINGLRIAGVLVIVFGVVLVGLSNQQAVN